MARLSYRYGYGYRFRLRSRVSSIMRGWTQKRGGAVLFRDRYRNLKLFGADVLANDGTFILTEPAGTNLIPWSDDLTYWTLRGTATASYDGDISLCSVGAQAVDDMFLTSVLMPEPILPLSVSLYLAEGYSGTLNFINSRNVNYGHWVIDLSLVEKSGMITNAHPAVTEITAWASDAASRCAWLFYADSGTVQFATKLIQTTVDPHISSPIPTNGAPATRAATTETKRELTSNELSLLRGEPDGVEKAVGLTLYHGTTLINGIYNVDYTVGSFAVLGRLDGVLQEGETYKYTLEMLTVEAGALPLYIGSGDPIASPSEIGITEGTVISSADGRIMFASSLFVGSFTLSVQKLDPIRTQIETEVEFGADWDVGLGSGEFTKLINFTSGNLLNAKNSGGTNGQIDLTDGATLTTYMLDWQANTLYSISIRCGNETDMLQPNGDPLTGLAPGNWFQIGVDGVWGAPSVFTGHWPVDVDEDGNAWIYLSYNIPVFSMEIKPSTIIGPHLEQLIVDGEPAFDVHGEPLFVSVL